MRNIDKVFSALFGASKPLTTPEVARRSGLYIPDARSALNQLKRSGLARVTGTRDEFRRTPFGRAKVKMNLWEAI